MPWLLASWLLAGCSTPDDSSEVASASFRRIPLTEDLDGNGLHHKVHVVRDRYGIAHIYADDADDAAFAQGFVIAHDRLPQMDLLRRFGAGTISEIYGAIDPSVIDTDLQMRLHRLRPIAEESFAIMQASHDRTDRAIVRTLQRYADGVNAYATQLAAGDHWSLDPNIAAVWEPRTFVPWTPIDSLVLGRFQALSLSFSIENELNLTELYQRLHQVYDAPGQPPAIADRNLISRDLMRLAPVGQIPTIDGFPNVERDTGTRADAGRSCARRDGEHRFRDDDERDDHGRDDDARRCSRRDGEGRSAAPRQLAASAQRPVIPADVLAGARTNFPANFHTGPLGTFGPQAFMSPRAGSNNWAVSPSKAGGKTLLGTDQHLQLSNPSIFYPIHMDIKHDTEVLGVAFPGIPGIILGTNGDVAWSGTVANHDVNDIYLEQVSPCGAADCVAFQGGQVPIETWQETIRIGIFGNILSERTVSYERVPHHGPILPTIRQGGIEPRTGTTALSVKYTGYQPSFELRAVWDLMRAKTVDQAFYSLRNFNFGGQNWTLIDNRGNIGWTSNVEVPVRDPNAMTWNATSNPGGNAPWFVLPGDGSAEWQGRLSSRYVPHAINPSSGYLATANSDPVGATFDDDGLNQPEVDGRPLYVGVGYAAGLRLERISTLLEGAMARGPIRLSDFAAIQHDSESTVGRKLAGTIAESLAWVADPSGAPADVAAYVAGLTAAQRAQLASARTLLAQWSFKTPAAVADGSSAAQIQDSAATTVFNTWMHFFIEQTLDDELALVGFERSRLDDSRLVRLVFAMLEEPATMVQSASSQQPILCDRVSVDGADDSCTKMQLSAMLATLAHLASADGYGSADPQAWRWGAKHRSVIASVLPNPGLNLPDASDGPVLAGGFPRAGDTFVINRADAGWNDLDFAQSSDGAAQRFLAEAQRGRRIKVKWQIPGGTVFDSRSPHYRDLLDNWYLPERHFDAPFEKRDVIDNAEERWQLR